MDRHLNLIKTNYKAIEKRVFPRFPFSYLTFRDGDKKHTSAFQVINISKTGMQICLKNGGHSFIPNQDLRGTVHWKRASVDIHGKVKWVKGHQLGVEFSECSELGKSLAQFLSIENIVAGMRPVHGSDFDLQIPSSLKYWLRADGPVEIFIWQHTDSELSRFQLILLDHFVEWEDGQGLKTGRVLRHKDVDSPLNPEDEFLFEFEESVDTQKLEFAHSVICQLPSDYIPPDVSDFLRVKLGKVLA